MKQNKFDKIKGLFKKRTEEGGSPEKMKAHKKQGGSPEKTKKHKKQGGFSAKTKKHKKQGLAQGMIRVIIFCLLIPYLSLSVVLFYFSTIKTNGRIKETVKTSMENTAELCSINIQSSIEASKKASYDGVIRESYNDFLETNDETQMYETVSAYLNNTYKYSSSIANTILLFNRKTSMEYYTYSNIAGSTYANIYYFKINVLPTIVKEIKNLGTKTKLLIVGNNLYLVRSLVTSDYSPFATLVMEINVDQMFKSMDNIAWNQSGFICIDGEWLSPSDNISEEVQKELTEYVQECGLDQESLGEGETVCNYDYHKAIACLTTKVNGQEISYVVKLDKVSILSEKGTLIYAYMFIIVLLIPLLYGTIRYFYTNISRPISELMLASEKIEEGEYGYKLEEFDKNEEFGKMIDTFNHMSVGLKESFNRIYAEEIALRDANMQALQSQINPHFLNNTLEIINWKARMSGNDDVSGMIESLGIMMEATMNRKNESFITIREELKYVDAYLYIIVQRFGSKFQFSKSVDESVLDLRIPRLIIQPLVENAVEHGGDIYGNRIGRLRIFEDEKYLHIIVENNGDIKEEDAKKIEELLQSEKIEKNMQNIGIRNVNLRLKMLYGQQSGLTIINPENNLTISKIVIDKKSLEESQ